jgi:hypothetical protein
VGASWRIQDAANREEFYIRSHQAENPDANQYTPIFNGLSAWQLYHGEGFGAPVDYPFETWIPVKIVVSGDQAEVYIGDLEKPALFIDDLKRDAADERKWTVLETEATGLANLSRVNPLTREANTVFARVTVVSDRAQPKTLAVGYSDRLRLFLNGKLLYTGNNGYRTRDYRYLGTIGYFDAITLPLRKGENELWLAVSESFGGWGVQAALDDMNGITLVEK